jgi:TetR/AcrR family transcriptional repressor of mexJK operon
MAKTTKTTAERIIEAATERFLSDGYDNTNLEQVAVDAGVTKPTVYSHFGSKEKLLIAITEAHLCEKATQMSSALATSGDTRKDLNHFADIFLQRVQSEQANCWHHLAMTQSREHPEVGQAIFAAGPARVLAAVTKFIEVETKAGRLTCSDPEAAAEQFLGMLNGMNPIRVMTGQPMPSKSNQRRICADAVTTFMAAFGKA